VDAWYEEETDYVYGYNDISGRNGAVVGHFTQCKLTWCVASVERS
jgi:hypothetical protein